jgi:hypothetical protein
MNTLQIGGAIGPFRDPVSGQECRGTVQGTFTFVAQGDPNAVAQQLQAGLLQAIGAVIAQKLAANQVAIPTVQGSLPYFQNEIIAASGAQNLGVQITGLQLTVQIDNPYAVQPYTGAMPPDPMQSTANAFKQAAADHLDPRNYEYEAKVNIGGFKIGASTDKGLDTDGLKKQVGDKVKSNLIWYGAGCVVVLIVLLGLGGLGVYIYLQYVKASAAGAGAAPSGAAKTAVWDGKSTYTCSGSDNVTITGTKANLSSGTAVTASGNCRLQLVNVDITAPTGIEALATAVVTVQGGSVTSSTLAAKAMGSGQVIFQGTKVSGKTQALGGSAKITGP